VVELFFIIRLIEVVVKLLFFLIFVFVIDVVVKFLFFFFFLESTEFQPISSPWVARSAW
jgi:hypothetical protein